MAVDFLCNIFAKQFYPPEIGGFYLLLSSYMNFLINFLTSVKTWTISDTVLFVQKGVVDYVVSLLGNNRGFWRKWFIELNWNILFQVKTPQDITTGGKLFSDKQQFILTGTDVLKKWEIWGDFSDTVIENIPSKSVWWCESTLSIFGQMSSLEQMTQGNSPDIIYTRWASILTQSAIEVAYPDSNIDVREVDGNTEAYIRLEYLTWKDRIVCWTEFVQTGKSLIETDSFILRSDGIYAPMRLEEGNFKWLQDNLSAQAQAFAMALTLEVNVLFAQIFPKK